MSESAKTHYRKVFKSDHLGQADLEDFIEAGSSLVFIVSHVKQENGVMVAGRKGNYNIAYFQEKIKPLVINATNSKVMKQFAGGSPFVEDWVNIPVRLYIDPSVKMKGETVGGVRISPDAPRLTKPELVPGGKKWDSAKDAYKRDGNLEKVLSRCTMTEEHIEQLIEECK